MYKPYYLQPRLLKLKFNKRRPFRRTDKPTKKELKETFELFVNVAIAQYRKEEKELEEYSTEHPDWGIEYGNQTISAWDCMRKALEQFGLEPEGKSLDWVCDNCGETNCDCNEDEEED